MKLLLITGASRAVMWFRRELIRDAQARGCEVTVVSCDGDERERISALGVEFRCVGGDNRDTGVASNLRYVRALTRLIRGLAPDRVMTFQAKANTFGIVAARRAGVPCAHIHATVEGLGSVFHCDGFRTKLIRAVSVILYRQSFRKIGSVFFLNTDDRDTMLRKKLVRDRQVVTIPGIGVDLGYYAPIPLVDSAVTKFAMVARAEYEKGVREYCEAARRLRAEGAAAEFHYYGGSGSADAVLDAYADVVRIHGQIPDMRDALRIRRSSFYRVITRGCLAL